MKTTIRFIAVFGFLFSVACGAKKNTQSKLDENQKMATAEGINENREETGEANTAETGKVVVAAYAEDINESNRSVQGNNGSTESNVNNEATSTPVTEEADYSQLYAEIGMDENQIQSIETAMENFKERQRNTPNGAMMGTVENEMERQLEKILSAQQFSAYQTLKAND